MKATFLAISIFVCAGVQLSALSFSRISLNDAAQDGTGMVWGTSTNSLQVWNGTDWTSAFSLPEAHPIRVSGSRDGFVRCLWAKKKQCVLTKHKGKESLFLGAFPSLSCNNIFVDSLNNSWMTSGNQIFQVSETGNLLQVYTISAQHFISDANQLEQQNYNPIAVVEDRSGRIWFWTPRFNAPQNYLSLKGLYSIRESSAIYHEPVPPTKGSYSALAAKDENTLWVAETSGLYEMDTQTFKVRKVPEPAPDVFRHIQTIAADGEDFLFLTGCPCWPDAEFADRLGALWRYESGKWHKLWDGLDAEISSESLLRRAMIPAGNEIWVAGYGMGIWVLKKDQPVIKLIDWRRGNPLMTPDKIFRLADKSMLIIQFHRGSVVFQQVPDAMKANTVEIKTMRTYRGVVQDRTKGIWTIHFHKDGVVKKWDGKSWTTYPVPKSIDLRHIFLRADTIGRIWLTPDCPATSAGILDPSSFEWKFYPDFVAAVQSEIAKYPGLKILSSDVPFYDRSKKRAAFADMHGVIHYFNGSAWKQVDPKMIMNETPHIITGPMFNDKDVLCFGKWAAKKSWINTETDQWQMVQETCDPKTTVSFEKTATCPDRLTTSLVRDPSEDFWFTSENRLFKRVGGVCVPFFREEEPNPFITGAPVQQVLTDPEGNIVFALKSYTYAMATFKESAPETVVKFIRPSANSVHMRFETKGTASYFQWRLDDQKWSGPGKDPTHAFLWLSPGKHFIEAVALDDRLRADLTPARYDFSVDLSEEEHLASILNALANPDYDLREQALLRLVEMGDSALPALKTIRSKTDDENLLFWIDAAIQRILNSAQGLAIDREN